MAKTNVFKKAGEGKPIEVKHGTVKPAEIKTAKDQIVTTMKAFQPDYDDWQVPVTYRIITTSRTL